MTDEMVLRAQEFVNREYGDVIGMTVPEDGLTGWVTLYGLTRALQVELGITALSNSFGPGTLAALTSRFPALDAATVPSVNMCRIVQSALYCKGYDGDGISGRYTARVEAAIARLEADMGVATISPGSALTPKVFKGLLTMDPYVTVGAGTPAVREVQQWLNGRYLARRDFFVIPCDGRHSRTVAKALTLAVQYELGLADGVATGTFGPSTQTGLKAQRLAPGSIGSWVSLFTAALLLNQRPAVFTSVFDVGTQQVVRDYQQFVGLQRTGVSDFPTWASLLVSYGDQARLGEAADCVTRVTAERAATLNAQGVRYVGRYLTGVSATALPEKALQPGELQTIAGNGLRCFPIYQTTGRDASGFNYPLGRAAGYAAMNIAEKRGFLPGTRIYFAVDFDALDEEISANVLPHFTGIRDSFADAGNPFAIGVYGARNVCSRVAAAGHSTASFVADMSSGFSGNLGYPLPADWAFDQFVTRTVGSDAGRIEIDNSIASGRDTGQGTFREPRPELPDTALDPALWSALQTDLGLYTESIGLPIDGGLMLWQHWKCVQTAITDHDALITELSLKYKMRKALIQTVAYWEMRHLNELDLDTDAAVWAYHHTPLIDRPPLLPRDSSTGIAQIFGVTGILAWNNAIATRRAEGVLRDPQNDDDVFWMWSRLKDDVEHTLTTAALVHLWDADGKPSVPGRPGSEPALRAPDWDYSETEVFDLLRRYQGAGAAAVRGAQQRLAVYYILEKYNNLSRDP